MSSKWKQVYVYALSHFIMDFCCAFFMFYYMKDNHKWYLLILIYNFCAFAMQMPIGLLADYINKNIVVTFLGGVLVATAYIITPIPILAVIAAGIGNALFHIGAGIEVLNISEKRGGFLGVFVSPGAFGIYLGTLLGKKGSVPPAICAALALFSALLMLLFYLVKNKSIKSHNQPFSMKAETPFAINGLLSALLLLGVVILRSYVGMYQNFPWKKEGYWGIILIIGVVIGKMAGGFLADRLGALKVAVISLGTCAVLYYFSGYAVVGVLAVFLFNMTMPITLWALSAIYKGAKGFSFGILTFGLFIGFLPAYLEAPLLLTIEISFVLASILSLVFLTVALRKKGK